MFIWSDDFQHVWWKRGGKITQVWPQSKQKVPYFHRKQKECPEINADFIKHADVICLLTINENLKVIISTLYHVALSMKIYSQWLTPLSDYLLESKCRECPLPKAFQAQVLSKFGETWKTRKSMVPLLFANVAPELLLIWDDESFKKLWKPPWLSICNFTAGQF